MSKISFDDLPPEVVEMIETGEEFTVEMWKEASEDWHPFYKTVAVYARLQGEDKRAEAVAKGETSELLQMDLGPDKEDVDGHYLSLALYHSSDVVLERIWLAVDGDQILKDFPPRP